ncbi:MAG: ribonuclease HIII [Kiritimatiellaeota bacterium]|nr:ribonuclease HIII [Kiritimatiellota bacterium]
MATPAKTSYVQKLTPDQVRKLHDLLDGKGWEFAPAPYAHWRTARDNVVVMAYTSGKLVVQGKGTPDFVQFILEPHVLGEARFGYEAVLAEEESPEMFEPHAGVDESGKGDYFGPLVTAAVFVDRLSAREMLQLGVADSKSFRNDKRITGLASEIRRITAGRFSIVSIGPEAYNRLHDKMANVNLILGWAHARAIENLLEKTPECPRVISDQFGDRRTVQRALMKRGKSIRLEQFPRAEADVAVAAASILARAEFVRRLDKLGEMLKVKLPKGASKAVIEAARKIVETDGRDVLRKVAKLHFRTTGKVLGTA